MSAFLITVLLYFPLTFGYLRLVAEPGDHRFLMANTIIAWVLLGAIVIGMNSWMPFSVGGDDEGYYYTANTPIESFSDIFDLGKWANTMNQPGYPWLLSLLNAVVGQDLLAFKLANLMFFIMLALTWYRIGFMLEGSSLGRAAMIGVLLLTPLWYYFFFLLKDMTIALLQAIFLLGLVQQWRVNHLREWLIIGGSTLFLVLFRVYLFLQNAGIFLMAVGVQIINKRLTINLIMSVAIGIAVIPFLLAILSNVEVMSSLGIYAEDNIIGSERMRTRLESSGASGASSRLLFPFIYLFTEVSGFNPVTWDNFDSEWLRGFLALPWIFFLVPLIILGLRWLFRASISAKPHGLLGWFWVSRVATTPWAIILISVLTSFAISWASGDTTRWRIADMPAWVTIGLAGWLMTGKKFRTNVLILWITGFGSLILAYYLVREL